MKELKTLKELIDKDVVNLQKELAVRQNQDVEAAVLDKVSSHRSNEAGSQPYDDLPNNVKAAVYIEIKAQLLKQLKDLDEREMETVNELKQKLQDEKRNSLQKIKTDLKNAGSTGDQKEFSKTMSKFEKERKSAEKALEDKY